MKPDSNFVMPGIKVDIDIDDMAEVPTEGNVSAVGRKRRRSKSKERRTPPKSRKSSDGESYRRE